MRFPLLFSQLRRACFWAASLLLPVWFLQAQPTGGPYGPIDQVYEIPADANIVYFVAPDGDPESSGTELERPSTLGAAIERAVTGDAIILRGGEYRTGGHIFNQGITFQPYRDERPVLKGTKIATEWVSSREGYWRTQWEHLFPNEPQPWWRREREGMFTPLHRFNNDMVFINGRQLLSAGWEGELDENTFFINYETGEVILAQDPTDSVVEITAWNFAFIRTTEDVHGKQNDKIGPTIRGLTFTQYAFRAIEIGDEIEDPTGPAEPGTYGQDIIGTTLEHVTITHTSRVAAYLRGDRVVVRNCLISDTVTEGLFLLGSSDSLFENNIIRRNNMANMTGYYPTALKIFNQSHRVIARNNLIMENPHSSGIWYDVGNNDGIFYNNWIQDTNDGFFFEISTGAICMGNVFVNCNRGIRILNAAQVHVVHNTFYNSVASFERSGRSAEGDHFDWHPATGPDVDERVEHTFTHNLMVADAEFDGPLIQFLQPPAMCDRLQTHQVSALDHNVYIRPEVNAAQPLIRWSPINAENCMADFRSLEAFREALPQYEHAGVEKIGLHGSVFQSPVTGRFQVLPHIELPQNRLNISDEMRNFLGWAADAQVVPGAYPTQL